MKFVFSYYVMDGSKRRVQFNEEIATEETEVPDFQAEVEEEEEEAEENVWIRSLFRNFANFSLGFRKKMI